MTMPDPSESLHRLVKQAIDSGAALSVPEAEAMFRGYRAHFNIDDDEATDRHHQAALLAGIALAKRVFLGGVTVTGAMKAPLRTPLPLGQTLSDAVQRLGAEVLDTSPAGVPVIHIGGAPRARGNGFSVRAVFSDWRAGVIPAHANTFQPSTTVMALAPMLAAALAVSEAFFHVQGQTPIAGRRPVGLSLWRPDASNWLTYEEGAPPLQFLPSNLWLIGLGHLGQAFLWALMLLPYATPRELSLVLQDIDTITASTESTSVLSDSSMIGTKKTRAMAAWAESRGFSTAIVERLFDANFKRAETDPAIALCGLDNAMGRLALDGASFPLVIEAGLGRNHRNFQTIRLHTLPGNRTAAEIWGAPEAEDEALTARPAYEKLLEEGHLDQCGVTLLAGKAVGAPFVGATAATLVIAELLRLLHGGPLSQLVDLDLRSPDNRLMVPSRTPPTVNPGYTMAEPS
jgi:hypothetical protein